MICTNPNGLPFLRDGSALPSQLLLWRIHKGTLPFPERPLPTTAHVPQISLTVSSSSSQPSLSVGQKTGGSPFQVTCTLPSSVFFNSKLVPSIKTSCPRVRKTLVSILGSSSDVHLRQTEGRACMWGCSWALEVGVRLGYSGCSSWLRPAESADESGDNWLAVPESAQFSAPLHAGTKRTGKKCEK